MAFYKTSSSNGIDSITLNLYGYAWGSGDSKGTTSGKGTYDLTDTYISQITYVSGSNAISMTYTNNASNQTVTVNITAGQTVVIDNDKGVKFAWSASSGYDQSSSSFNRTMEIAIDFK